MGSRNLDRLPPEDWRAEAETVTEMADKGWDVFSKCRVCGLQMSTSLRLVARISGPETSLWSKPKPCRRMGCTGVVDFFGKPPSLSRHIRLDAAWPEHKRRYPVGDRR